MEFKGFDFKAAMKVCMNPKFYVRFLTKFDQTMLTDLKAAVAAGTVADIQRHAHSIKGVSANLGFTELNALALAVELKAKEGIAVPADDSDLLALTETYNYVLERVAAIITDPDIITPYL